MVSSESSSLGVTKGVRFMVDEGKDNTTAPTVILFRALALGMATLAVVVLSDIAEAGCNPPPGTEATVASFTVTDVGSSASKTVVVGTPDDNGGKLFICDPPSGTVEIQMSATGTRLEHVGWRVESATSMDASCNTTRALSDAADENEGPVQSSSSGCPGKDPDYPRSRH